ncbi:UDP-N-acetyl-D-mannosamine dehydrogenase [Lysobacter cavernae]|uniref:UDP-N-acetyl-D-mannosamine dehydrogenase n=1 Tax=Lysobacter cavernae TaxID=1685901 RepID=A0ABV7RPF5_9GAMM
MKVSKGFPSSVSVIGLGYIGLPTATMFASRKVNVVGVDINQKAVDIINDGRIHIVEPELDILVHAVVTEGYLRATTKPEPADAFLIAVPTPFKNGHVPDLSYVEAAAKSIAPVLKAGDLVVLESTSPVGTTEKMASWLANARPDLKFPIPGVETPDVHVAYCPERVLPGQVVHELVVNDRIIGGLTAKCAELAAKVYEVFVEGQLVRTDARTAELCKLTENSFRDVNIAFANELSIICDRLGINVWELIKLANHHPRVNILKPGCGVGGHCIAVDPWFIVDSAPEEARMIRMAREINNDKPHVVLRWINEAVQSVVVSGKRIEDASIAILGLAFKPDIDDLRESPALGIAEKVVSTWSGDLLVVEPNIDELPASLGSATMVDLRTALNRADILVTLVAHREFAEISRNVRPGVIMVDAVGIRDVENDGSEIIAPWQEARRAIR